MKIELKQDTGLLFQAKNDLGNQINVGISNSITDNAIRPMELLLMGLAGCSSVDVIGILRKQKQIVDSYNVTVEAERVKAIPAIFKTITISFILDGNIHPDKAQKAIELSVHKYCSVSKILDKSAIITTKLILNNTEI